MKERLKGANTGVREDNTVFQKGEQESGKDGNSLVEG